MNENLEHKVAHLPVHPAIFNLAKELAKENYPPLTWKKLKKLDIPSLISLFGRNHAKQLDDALKREKIIKSHLTPCFEEYDRIAKTFTEIIKEHFDSLLNNFAILPQEGSILGSRSSFNSRPLRDLAIQTIRTFFLTQPYPLVFAKFYKIYKIVPRKGDARPGLFEYVKALQEKDINHIQTIYHLFSHTKKKSHKFTILEALEREVAELKTPALLPDCTWKTCIQEWSSHPEWGGQIDGLNSLVQTFVKTYQLTPLLEGRAPDNCFNRQGEVSLPKSSIKIPRKKSLHAYVIKTTSYQLLNYILNEVNISWEEIPAIVKERISKYVKKKFCAFI